jgi:hypothetical protein
MALAFKDVAGALGYTFTPYADRCPFACPYAWPGPNGASLDGHGERRLRGRPDSGADRPAGSGLGLQPWRDHAADWRLLR